jgi:hypothetical protein
MHLVLAPRRPQTRTPEVRPTIGAWLASDVDPLNASIQRLTQTIGGQPHARSERELPQLVAAEVVRRVRADVVVLLLDNGEGVMEMSCEVGLPPAERRASVQYNHEVLRELFRTGVGLIEDTDRVREALAGIPGGRAKTLAMVPLVHDRLGFGVLIAGRHPGQTGVLPEVFTDDEIQVLLGLADAAAESLQTAVLLRRLNRQLKVDPPG